MAYGDIPDLIFTTDADGNVVYTTGSNGPSKTGTGSTTETGKKWWEQLFGIFPAIITGIFGNNPQPQTPYYPAGPSSQTQNSNNLMIILIAAAVIIFILLKKK